MGQPMRRHFKSFLVASAILSTNAGCGGCPWITTSDAEVSDNATCLDLDVADGSGNPPSSSCVDPVVFGTNGCAVDLVVPAEFSTTGEEVTVAPGGAIELEVPLFSGDYDKDEDRYTFLIAAQLGDDPVAITFTAE